MLYYASMLRGWQLVWILVRTDHPCLGWDVTVYVVACAAFYEQGFSVPSHQFLRSLMLYYALELHHLIPSGVLHITTFATFCKADVEIEPHFDRWNYFFRVRLLQVLGVEVAVLGGMDIYVEFRHGFDLYFHLPLSESMDDWR
jgi:hypothetical protein